jgi:hypothetical protein
MVPEGHLVIDASTRVMLPMDENKPHCFDVTTAAIAMPVRMQCVNNRTRNEWLTAICGVAERSKEKRAVELTRRAPGSVLQREADKRKAMMDTTRPLQRRQRKYMDRSTTSRSGTSTRSRVPSSRPAGGGTSARGGRERHQYRD